MKNFTIKQPYRLFFWLIFYISSIYFYKDLSVFVVGGVINPVTLIYTINTRKNEKQQKVETTEGALFIIYFLCGVGETRGSNIE